MKIWSKYSDRTDDYLNNNNVESDNNDNNTNNENNGIDNDMNIDNCNNDSNDNESNNGDNEKKQKKERTSRMNRIMMKPIIVCEDILRPSVRMCISSIDNRVPREKHQILCNQ